jgi:hypothetical protein
MQKKSLQAQLIEEKARQILIDLEEYQRKEKNYLRSKSMGHQEDSQPTNKNKIVDSARKRQTNAKLQKLLSLEGTHLSQHYRYPFSDKQSKLSKLVANGLPHIPMPTAMENLHKSYALNGEISAIEKYRQLARSFKLTNNQMEVLDELKNRNTQSNSENYIEKSNEIINFQDELKDILNDAKTISKSGNYEKALLLLKQGEELYLSSKNELHHRNHIIVTMMEELMFLKCEYLISLADFDKVGMILDSMKSKSQNNDIRMAQIFKYYGDLNYKKGSYKDSKAYYTEVNNN